MNYRPNDPGNERATDNLQQGGRAVIHLDLFSGIGGFALAVDAVWENVEHIFCEIDKYCQALLKKRFPRSVIYGDIRTLSRERFIADTDRRRSEKQELQTTRDKQCGGECFILTGGFPCQPFSQAGKRKGTDDNRYLWPEMLRVIRDFKPTWVIAENVRGILTIEQGMVFEQVCLDLEGEGYKVQPFIIPAVAVNAPHRRDRVWFVANRRCTHGQRKSYGGETARKIQCQEITVKSERPDTDENNASDISSKRPDRGSENKSKQQSALFRENIQSDSDAKCWEQNWLEVAGKFCRVYDGCSDWIHRCFDEVIMEEDYGKTISESGRQDLSYLWEGIQQKEIWEGIRGYISLLEQTDLLAILRELQEKSKRQNDIQYSGKESFEENGMRCMWRNAQFRRSSHRRQHQEQFARELKNLMPQLSYEVALEVAKIWDYIQCGWSSMISPEINSDGLKLSKSRHRVERLKALGNAIVPQVAVEIMRAIRSVGYRV